jgi:hypothetical protein
LKKTKAKYNTQNGVRYQTSVFTNLISAFYIVSSQQKQKVIKQEYFLLNMLRLKNRSERESREVLAG